MSEIANPDPGRSVEFRRAREADLAAEYAVFDAAMRALHQRHAVAWAASPFERWRAIHRHLLVQDGVRSHVAECHGRVVGFTAALVRGDLWYFSALFVHPEFQGRGIGARLFELARDGAYRRQVTITEAIQPASNGLYSRKGLLPTVPILHFGGRPVVEPPGDLRAERTDVAALAALDAVGYGCNRASDHAFWTTVSEGRLWVRRGDPVAYAYNRPDGVIGPLVGRDPQAAADALRAELAQHIGDDVTVMIPGSARALLRVAVAAGLRYSRMPGLLLVSDAAVPPVALAISGYWLY